MKAASLTTPADPPQASRATTASRLAAMVELTKPRIVLMEVVAVVVVLHAATGYGAAGSVWSPALALAVAVGTTLVAGSANALNQWIEVERDRRMLRTRTRPIPSDRLTPQDAFAFGLVTLAMGVSTLAMYAGATPALVAIATWAVYVAVYTPLKAVSWINTAVGAVSGAAPLWIGWTAGGGSLSDPMAWAIAAVLYLWQFPHFMAIAWICREDYARAEYRMTTHYDPSGFWAGVQAVVGAAVLLPVSLTPLLFTRDAAPLVYALPVFLAGSAMLAASASFLSRRDDTAARRLLRVSLVYVPVWLLALWSAGV